MAVDVYSDGSSSGTATAPIGWGWVVLKDGNVTYAGFGGAPLGSNNQAELWGALCGLDKVAASGLWTPGEPLTLISDSMYVLGLANGSYVAKKNPELAHRLRYLMMQFRGKTRWVRGHQLQQQNAKEPTLDVLMNHRCDSLAAKGKATYTPEKVLKKQAKAKEARKPAFAKGSDTSEEAAASMLSAAGEVRERVYQAVLASPSGLTCDECEVLLDLRHQTASARFNELYNACRIVDSGERRKTRSKRNAVVWVAQTAIQNSL